MREFHKINQLWSAKQFCHKNRIENYSSEMNRTSAHSKFPRKIGYINKIFFVVRLYLNKQSCSAGKTISWDIRRWQYHFCRLISSRVNPFLTWIIPE